MKLKHVLLVINLILLVTLSACRRDKLHVNISDGDLEFSIERFDRELFNIDFDKIDSTISALYRKYDDFFDVYNVHVINIGPASDRYYASYLSMFVNDPQNKELYAYTQQKFKNLDGLEEELTDALKRYKIHFPESSLPRIVTYIGGFNQKLFTVGNFIGIGLDEYLGKETPYYDMLNIPEYMQVNMFPGKIPSDLAQVWGAALFPFNDSVDNVLCRMIHEGLMLYFTDVLFPDMDESLKIGFTVDQTGFCKKNEKQMWTYLVEHDLLFSTDQLEIKKLIEEAPTTYYFPAESPGRACIWIGWQIVKEYARRNPNLEVTEILGETDYQKILKYSRYNP